jgi:membrane-associated phospholipid phosphatase
MKKILLLVVLLNSLALYSQNADITLLRKINLGRNETPDEAFKILSQTARPFSITAPALVFGIGLISNNKNTRQKGLMMGASFFTATAITTTLKYSINRERPYTTYPDLEKISVGGIPSFPSGHTSDAFSNATSLSLAFPKWYVIAPSYVYAAAVGYSRMHLGVHYPSDVVAGAVVGAGSAYLCYKAQKWISNHKSKKKRIR